MRDKGGGAGIRYVVDRLKSFESVEGREAKFDDQEIAGEIL